MFNKYLNLGEIHHLLKLHDMKNSQESQANVVLGCLSQPATSFFSIYIWQKLFITKSDF